MSHRFFFFFGKIGGLPIFLLILWPFKAVFDKQPERYKFCSRRPNPARNLRFGGLLNRSVRTALSAILLAPHTCQHSCGVPLLSLAEKLYVGLIVYIRRLAENMVFSWRVYQRPSNNDGQTLID